MQKALGLQVGGTEGQKVDGCEAGLLAGWDKDDDGRLGRVLADGLVDWFHHGNQPRWGVGDIETLRSGGG